MTVVGKRVTVTTTATKLNSATSDSAFGSSVIVRTPTGAADIDLGGATVTTGTGYALAANTALPVDLQSEDLYAITASGTVVVHVLENGT